MNIEQLHQQDDTAVTTFLSSERALFSKVAVSPLSQENWAHMDMNASHMRAAFEAQREAMMHGMPEQVTKIGAGKKIMIAAGGVTFLAAYAALVGAIAYGMVKLIQAKDANTKSRDEVVAEIKKDLMKASKPGMRVTLEGGDKSKLGRLMINGRPVTQIRGELEKLLKTDKAMTPEEYKKAVATVNAGSEKFLTELDNLNRVAQQYQSNRNMSMMGMGLMTLLFTPISLITWLGYRIYQFLFRKLS